jgi:hypothetical protein
MVNNGFTFDHWSSGSHAFSPNAASDSVYINLNADDSIIAHFVGAGVDEYHDENCSLSVYPNVFSENFTITYTLPSAMPVSIRMITLEGREAYTIALDDKNMPQGCHIINVSMKASKLAPGMYILSFAAGDYKRSARLIYSPR